MDLSIVIVNWNVRDLLRQCLCSIEASWAAAESPASLLAANCETIVVDSASEDGSAAMVRDEFPNVLLIASDENLGYARGNNLGLGRATGEYLLVLNPDTEIVADGLPAMLNYLRSHDRAGAIGPQLRYPDGSLQSSRRRFPTPATAFWESTLLQQWFPDNRFARRYHVQDRPADEVQAVDWVVGAALMMRRSAWEQTGPFDESFFMYFEELDWCRRCRGLGWEIDYLPLACVVHHEGKSSQQVPAERTIRFQSSKLRYFDKYYGRLTATLIRLFLLATFGFQLLEEAIKWLLGHKRALRRQRVAAYGKVLRSGLPIPRKG